MTKKKPQKKIKKRKYTKKPFEQRSIALERINTLFKQAAGMFSRNSKLSHRYVHLARRIAMKLKIRIPSKLKRRFCKYCYHYLVPGKNCIVRLKQHTIRYQCLDCNKISYFPYLKEQKLSKQRKIKKA